MGEDFDVWRILRGGLGVEKILEEGFALVIILEEGLLMVGHTLEERGMKNWRGFGGLHLESVTYIKL